MTQALAYRNGQFRPGPFEELPVFDAGFVFGATVTDLVRTFQHKLFRFDDHLTRFRASCRLCRIPLPIGDHDLRMDAAKLIEHNAALLWPNQELALVMLATPGPVLHYLGVPADKAPEIVPATYMMHTFPLPFDRYRKLFTDGATLVVPPTRPIPAECIDPRAKMRSRMQWWIAEQQAHDIDPNASALLVDAAGHVTETAAANFLIVKDGTVLTPPRDTVLNGVSLQVVEELCGELRIPFAERPLTLAECQSADEAMLTCTSYCVAGVRRLDGVELLWPGPVWRRLMAAWSARVEVDIEAQILQ
jgi:branched-subunit amino acid aminotransferase/4-amino-4-deoxychorismate lyase